MTRAIRFLKLIVGGAALAVTVFGTVSAPFGYDPSRGMDAVVAVLGAGLTAAVMTSTSRA